MLALIAFGKVLISLTALAFIARALRSRLRETGRRALSQQPDTITLRRLPEYRWRDPAAAEWLAAPLRGNGFADLGVYEIQPMHGYRIGIMLNERDNVAAFLNETPLGLTLELSVRYRDGTTTLLVNHADNGVPRPPFFRTIFAAPDAPSGQLYERLLRERPPSGIKTITADNVIPEFQAAYRKIMAYMKVRGLGAGEVSEIAARASQPMTTIPPKPQPTTDAAGTIACPHCGQVNEKAREVCWACFKLLSGAEKPAALAPPYQETTQGPVPEPLREQLEPGERVVWHGRPCDKLDLRDIPLIALPVSWVGGAGMLLVGSWLLRSCTQWRPAPSAVAQILVVVIGISFCIAGFYVLGGPFLQRFLRRRTFYAVTDRRVIIVHGRPLHRVVARDLTQVTCASVLSETWEGAGTLELGFNCWTVADSDFEFIENVQEVQALLLSAAAARAPAGVIAGDASRAS